jgi:methionine biosynthesis protein MetW
MSLLVSGRMPVTRTLGHAWHDTPNIHLCTISDFLALAQEVGAKIEQALALTDNQRTRPMHTSMWGPNIFAEGAIFLLSKK